MTLPAFARLTRLSTRCPIPRVALIGAASWLFIGTPLPAFGQLVRLEEATRIDGAVFALDYDPGHRAFLVGTRTDPVTYAIFVTPYGVEISRVALSNDPSLNVLGRTSYSTDLGDGTGGSGAFLLATAELSEVVAYPDRLVTYASYPMLQPTDCAPYCYLALSVADIAYSPASREFLAVLVGPPSGCFHVIPCSGVLAVRIGLDGQPLGAPLELCRNGCYNPTVAWNAMANEFGVSYLRLSDGIFLSRFSATGSLVGTTHVTASALSWSTDCVMAVNEVTGHYVTVWDGGYWYIDEDGTPTFHDEIRAAEIDPEGAVVAAGFITDRLEGRAAGIGLAYNPVGGTFLLAGRSRSDPTRLGAIELNGRGAPYSTLTYVANMDTEIAAWQRIRVESRTDARAWLIAFGKTPLSESYQVTDSYLQSVGTPSGNGGSEWPLGIMCTTPDPFEAIGGGQCVNGGWRPIDSAPLSAYTAGGCLRPDPFLSLGGGICVNGSWLPPGYPLPPGGSTGSTGGTATCTTPQPGATWVCVNGGWVPPDHPLAAGSTGGTTTCTSPQPGPTWVCVNGGWVPPDHPLARGGGN